MNPVERDGHNNRVLTEIDCFLPVSLHDGRHASSGLLADMELKEDFGKLLVDRDGFSGIEAFLRLRRRKRSARENFHPIREDRNHRFVERHPVVVKHGIDHGFSERSLVKKRDILSFHNPVFFIRLNDVEDLSVLKKPVQGVKKAVVAEFPDG